MNSIRATYDGSTQEAFDALDLGERSRWVVPNPFGPERRKRKGRHGPAMIGQYIQRVTWPDGSHPLFANYWSRWRQEDTLFFDGLSLTPAHYTIRQGFVRHAQWMRDGRTPAEQERDAARIAAQFRRLHA